MVRGVPKTVVKRTRDEALEHIKTALWTNSCLFTRQEMGFIRTSCHILGLDGNAMMKAVMSEVKDRGIKQPRNVMEYLQSRLKELADRVEKHKRPTPNPAASTRAANSMGAPARSLGNLVGCAEALKEAIKGRYSKGIRAGMKAFENARADYETTIGRIADAYRWKAETTNGWLSKGELACGNLMGRAEAALKEAEEKEEAEAKIRIMETQCEELTGLAVQAGKQVPAEAKVEVLEELEEEMDHGEEMVGDLGRSLRETIPEGLKDRVEEAIKESAAIAAKGRRFVDHVKTRLDFSKDSESSSSKAAGGTVPGGWQTAAEELGEDLEEGFEEEIEEELRGPVGGLETGGAPEDETAGGTKAAPRYLVDFMRSFGQMQANDSGWPTFDMRYVSYPRFKKEWGAYRQTYHSAVSDDLAARTLRDKCLQGDALQMVSHLDDLREIWETLDTCYERPDKYMEEALRPIVDFRRYKISDSGAVREFYSLLRAAIKGARRIGRIELLINDQTIPRIMGKMPPIDWKEWATKRPDWMGQDTGTAFEAFVERKWLDALNIAAAEHSPWRGEGEKAAAGLWAPDKIAGGGRGVLKVTGAVNVVEQGDPPRSPSPLWDLSFGRKCRARNLIGCNGNHVMLQCEKLMSLGLAERKEVLEKSRLCMFCLKHSADLECYGKGGLSKPRCNQPGCDGEHTPGVHKLMGEENAGVNLVAEDKDTEDAEAEEDGGNEDEGWWVGTIGVMEASDGAEDALYGEAKPSRGQQAGYSKTEWGQQGESGPDHPLEDCSANEATEDEEWDLGSTHTGLGSGGAVSSCPGEPRRLPGGTIGPLRPTGVKQRRAKKEAATDQDWEEARRSALLRQMLSDTSVTRKRNATEGLPNLEDG
jgi:hypothetical protein